MLVPLLVRHVGVEDAFTDPYLGHLTLIYLPHVYDHLLSVDYFTAATLESDTHAEEIASSILSTSDLPLITTYEPRADADYIYSWLTQLARGISWPNTDWLVPYLHHRVKKAVPIGPNQVLVEFE